MFKLRIIQHLSAKAILVCFIMSLVSCAQFDRPQSLTINDQPGDYFVAQIKDKSLITQEQVVAMLQQPKYHNKNTQAYLAKDLQDSATLLRQISRTNNVGQAIQQLAKAEPSKSEKWIYLALKLYPIDAYRIVEQLYATTSLKESNLESAALMAGLEPARLFPATASSNLDYRIVPLIHSASLTVYKQSDDVDTRLWFKPSASNEWLPALALQWEPIMGALSGSIVRLAADTHYDIKLQFLDDTQVTEERVYSFQTRPDSPPIDPDKIYYLSDIYTGGQLNLATLGIEGDENGWAKIVGDGVEIMAGENDNAAIDIGGQSYVMFENITVRGGQRFGIRAKDAHHIWISGCNISQYGRVGEDMRKGIAYATTESTSPINYDSGIYLEHTGVVTVENCKIHDPNGKANNWDSGHPNGPNAMLISADHPTEEYRGQYIIRNNRFYGTPDHRFNDVIESRSNFNRRGAFGRDSAIYNNYLAYANDDLIELDGGQSNVLFYDNELTQGYCGVSVAPNMLGPSYIFNNYIHDLGDDRGKDWTAIKMGGLISRPAGITNLFENLIITNNNGVARSGVDGDNTFWLNAQNNIIISRIAGGHGIYDNEFYEGSVFKNNVIYNFTYGKPFVQATIGDDFYHPWSEQLDKIADIINLKTDLRLDIKPQFIIPNFSKVQLTEGGNSKPKNVDFEKTSISSTDAHDDKGTFKVEDNGTTLHLRGNTRKTIDLSYTITSDTVIQLDVKTNDLAEFIGLAFENDNQLSSSRLFKFADSQTKTQDEFQTITLPIGKLISGSIDRLVFVLDENQPGSLPAEAWFKNIKIFNNKDSAGAPPEDHSYYFLNPDWIGKTVKLTGLANNTLLTVGDISQYINRGQTINHKVTAKGEYVSADKSFVAGADADGLDMPVPSKFLGKQFAIPNVRYTHIYYLLSPFVDAKVYIKIGKNTRNIMLTAGKVFTLNAGSATKVVGQIKANVPILVSHSTNNNSDVYPVQPAATDLWGVRSQVAYVAATQDNTQVTVNADNGATQSFKLNAGAIKEIAIGLNTEQGQGSALHIIADKPVNAIQQADGDGSESTTFGSVDLFSTDFILPVNTQYIAIVCITNTNISLLDSANNTIATNSCLADSNKPGKAYFGQSAELTEIATGYQIKASNPVYVIYEAKASDDEHNLLGL